MRRRLWVWLWLLGIAASGYAQSGEWESLRTEAQSLYRMGKYDQAIVVAKKAVTVAEETAGPSHPSVAAGLSLLADIYQAQRDAPSAQALYARALAIYEKALSPHHPQAISTLDRLARSYAATMQREQAEQAYQRMIAVLESQRGLEHPDTLEAMKRLARFYAQSGNFTQAEQLYERVIAIEKTLSEPSGAPPGMPPAVVAQTQKELASLYMLQRGLPAEQRRIKDAEEKAEALYKQLFAVESFYFHSQADGFAQTLQTLADMHCRRQEYAPAAALYEQALNIRSGTPSGRDGHGVNLIGDMERLGDVYWVQGRYAQAEAFYKRRLDIQAKVGGDIAPNLDKLAWLYCAQGRFEEAERVHKQAIENAERRYGFESLPVAGRLESLAALYVAQGQYAQAEPLCRRALAIREKASEAQTSERLKLVSTLHLLASVYSLSARYAQAEPLYKRALAIREKEGPALDAGFQPDSITLLESLAELYRATDRAEEAKAYETRAAQLRRRGAK